MFDEFGETVLAAITLAAMLATAAVIMAVFR